MYNIATVSVVGFTSNLIGAVLYHQSTSMLGRIFVRVRVVVVVVRRYIHNRCVRGGGRRGGHVLALRVESIIPGALSYRTWKERAVTD